MVPFPPNTTALITAPLASTFWTLNLTSFSEKQKQTNKSVQWPAVNTPKKQRGQQTRFDCCGVEDPISPQESHL